MRRIALAIPLTLAIGAACALAPSTALAPGGSPSARVSATVDPLPKPIPQPITRTSAGAQVAWLSLPGSTERERAVLVGVDPTGTVVGRIDTAALDAYLITRSGDGASLVAFTGGDHIAVLSSADGKLLRTHDGPKVRALTTAFSADGKWLAVLLSGALVHLLDLQTGASQTLQLGQDPNAKLPGLGRNTSEALWGTLAFAPDSAHVYALTDWGGPVRLTAITLTGATWAQSPPAISGQGQTFPSCAGPGLALRVVHGGRTLAAFCNYDAAVWLFDLPAMSSVSLIHPQMANPFWIAPIFTPDGQLLYLHQWPGFGDQMQVVDLAARRLAGPVATPTRVGDRGPFSWLVGVAYAGGTASTMPVSPDSLRLYSATADGVVVLRIPDLAPIAKLASGTGTDEVWISGDGKTVFATAGARLVIARDDGSPARTIDLGKPYGTFVASERG